MKVIVASFIKTGTKSMAAALNTLGYKVYDFEHHFYYLGKDWLKIIKNGGGTNDFLRMYRDVDAACDVPFALFWEEILEAFPDAKIIFTQPRNETEWFSSVRKQNETFHGNIKFRLLSVLSYTGYKFFSYMTVINGLFLGTPPQWPWNVFSHLCPLVCKKRYRDHCTGVLQRAPKDRLLVFDFADGWAPLCSFLGKEIPSVPFPHENKGGRLVESWIASNPVFKRMQQEMAVSGIILAVLSSIGFYKIFQVLRSGGNGINFAALNPAVYFS